MAWSDLAAVDLAAYHIWIKAKWQVQLRSKHSHILVGVQYNVIGRDVTLD